MIPHGLIVRSLAKERHDWQCHEMRTQYVAGIIYGLTVAIKVVETLWVYTLQKVLTDKNYYHLCYDRCLQEAKRRKLHGHQAH